ncbi:DUF4123 domain-containing protein [Xenorhabdus nematophila]|uniref:DUF4123 domain-containing protein n=1 Tax=Xenorhabdus nematophila TaxID=628 RepID=UPI000544510E|nr:DUF4123 domain-containing protein [Xenorhabdus nematophila]CEE91842.1 conserved hypothetical protein [Xenorhabdus nematophila str. Anatoliense]AYA39120.1 DUF4123 domain-containing protein [Xenorhabdus nematophila]KHD27478.1 hypothetical protein LH67_17800 [Xenorhabdus nematophila]MBA0017704.1 DUF4123 domain-containing protein [Xenorhabdus nematophila]MCB4426671.1 DUF4123 domain-containing protein [Xenorhabdus nematophila]
MISASQEKWPEYQKMHPDMKWYALVDGLQYERLFDEELVYIADLNNPLFRQYPDAEIAFAGPWLFDMTQATVWTEKFLKLEKIFPAVSWLYTPLSLDTLTRHFEPYLNVQLASGETALLRFYDPRVLHQIRDIFNQEQLTAFTQHIDEWNYWLDGHDYSLKGAQ